LPYDLKPRAPEVKKKIHNFMDAAADSYGSGTSANSKQARSSASRSKEYRSQESKRGAGQEEEEEVISPLKTKEPQVRGGGSQAATNTNRQLFRAQSSDGQSKVRKRKSKGLGSSQTPDLNLPVIDTTALVPTNLVANHVSQMAK
jgi:hypothetical protein